MATLRAHDYCTPDHLLNIYPCFQCLTESELMAVLVYCLATANGYDLSDDLNELVSDAACVGCMNDKQKLESIVARVAASTLDTDVMDMAAIREDMACILCLDKNLVKALLVRMICEYVIICSAATADPVPT